MLFSGSIRKLLAFILLVALAPNLGIIIWSNLRQGRQELARAGAAALHATEDLGRECGHLVDSVGRTLDAMTAAPSIRNLQPEPAGQYLAAVLAGSPDLVSLALLDARGTVLAGPGPGMGTGLSSLAVSVLDQGGGAFLPRPRTGT